MASDRLSVVLRRPHPNGDARQAFDRLDDAEELWRAEDALVMAKTGGKIGDADAAPRLSVRIVDTIAVLRRYSDV